MKIVNVIVFDKILYIKVVHILFRNVWLEFAEFFWRKISIYLNWPFVLMTKNGRFRNSNRSVGNFVQDMGVEEAVLDSFNKGPRESAGTENCHNATGVSQKFVSKHLQREGLYSIHTISPEFRLSKQEIHLKVFSFVTGFSSSTEGIFSNNNYVAPMRRHNIHKRRHLQNPQRTLLSSPNPWIT